MPIKLEATPTETGIIKAIAERFVRSMVELGDRHWDTLSVEMDITACHLNGCPLRLGALLEAEAASFAHDVGGIIANLDRETGRLRNHFQPRFARPT